MKILLYLFYFMRSVSLRGFMNTIRLLKAELFFERKFGVLTAPIKKSSSKEFFHYQGAPYLALLTVLQDLAPQVKDLEFTDIGCGKGRALLAAEYCGFNFIKGIELDAELLAEAGSNLDRYRLKRKESTIQLLHANALEYEYSDVPSVYFMFNPFNETILHAVLEKIRQSTRSETWFIYMNPLFRTPFEEKNSTPVKEFKTGRYLETCVYYWPAV